MGTEFRLIGAGVYSLTEASRLTGIPKKRIRRWMEGRDYVKAGKRMHSPPIISSALGREVGELALTFADLVEIRFLDKFLERGVSWHVIRIAARRAADLLNVSHPFSTQTFKTDGRHILARIARPGNVPELLNLVRNQWEFEKIVDPLLFAGLDFGDDDRAERWWPMGRNRLVVLDPARSFGAPIVSSGGVPTAILAASAKAERSQKMAAQIYDVPVQAVKYAVEYETKYLAA